MIYHIYWGTSGNSGLYLDEIYQTLHEQGYNQRIFVSFYYPFNYGERIFFHYSDVAHCKHSGLVRKVMQGWEIMQAFCRILYSAYKEKPSVVNYSLISGSYGFVVHFLKVVKRLSGCKLVVTCHDVIPFGGHSAQSTEMKNRRKIFDLADYLLVHNENSARDLIEVFGADNRKILKHLFPIMDLTKIVKLKPVEKECDFLFIGHLRKEKGVDVLIDAWRKFHERNKAAKLWICGKSQKVYDEDELAKINITMRLGYINDENYCRYIQQARYVVLPYTMGTNSGIISTVFSLGRQVVTSDIPMLKENQLVNDDDMFVSENVDSLVERLEIKYKQKENMQSEYRISQYKEQFRQEVLSVYATLCNKAEIAKVGGVICELRFSHAAASAERRVAA